MILCSGREGAHRQSIGDALWSRSGEQQARTNLRQALSAVRKALGSISSSLQQKGDLLWLDRTYAWVDIDLISESAGPIADADIETLLNAGEFLQGIKLNEPGFDDWLAIWRATFAQRLQDCLAKACKDKLNQGAFSEAERISRKLIAVDNFNEAAHRTRMRALAGCGEAATALRHFIEFESLLKSELGVSPGVETLELARSLKSDVHVVDGAPPEAASQAPDLSIVPPEESPTFPSPQSEASPELRNVVVVCAEIFDDLARIQDAQSYLQDLADLSSQLSALLGDFGGTELSNTGGSLLAVFGYPSAHSKDGERALNFCTTALDSICRTMPGAQARIAMVSGIVLASPGAESNVLGDPVRRVQSQVHRTPDGRITVDRGVFRATSGLASYAPLESELWSVALGGEEVAPTRRSEFVGRERELRQALELLEDVQADGRGEVIVLRGEAGSAKRG